MDPATPAGTVQCPRCNGYGSSLTEDADRCTRCNGTGLIAADPDPGGWGRLEAMPKGRRVLRFEFNGPYIDGWHAVVVDTLRRQADEIEAGWYDTPDGFAEAEATTDGPVRVTWEQSAPEFDDHEAARLARLRREAERAVDPDLLRVQRERALRAVIREVPALLDQLETSHDNAAATSKHGNDEAT